MASLAEQFLSLAEQQQITAAVHQAEKQTTGEIVPMIVSTSHNYPLVAVTGGFLLSLALALTVNPLLGPQLWLGPQNLWLFLLLLSLFYLPMRVLVARSTLLKRLFLFADQVEEEVSEAATTAFYQQQLFATRERNGILLFVSVLEKQVWILADTGITARIDPSTWQTMVDSMTTGIRRGAQAQAICTAVEQIGALLHEHFPAAADDRNELHNLIIGR